MKRGLRLLLFVLITLTVGITVAFASIDPVKLELDGQAIEAETPPTIVQGRTMIPAKFLFEAMGGTVEWIEASRQVRVALEEKTVLLTIDSNSAFVDGTREEMDVPAMIIDQRTFIPVAFVAEKLGCTVNWSNDTRTVQITSPVKTEKLRILLIETETQSEQYRIFIEADGEIKNYKTFTYNEPDRFILDIFGALLDVDFDGGGEGRLEAGNEIFSGVRFAQFDANTVRIVADLSEKVPGRVSLSEDKRMIHIDFDRKDSGEEGEDGEEGGDDGDMILEGLDIPELDWRVQGKLIVIDPGHGGTDSGSLGYSSNGTIIQMEKDLNLTIALRLNELLKAAGANTYMLREKDQSITLYDRPAKANELKADLYISVHNNSNENKAPNGTETHYFDKTTDPSYGYTSKAIAESVQQELVKAVRLKDRGAKSSPLLAVLNKTQMPAIIIEGGFLSNSTELSYMMTKEFQENYALGAARGIIKALNNSVAE